MASRADHCDHIHVGWDAECRQGVDVVDRIVVVPGDQQSNGRPVEPVVICGVKIEPR